MKLRYSEQTLVKHALDIREDTHFAGSRREELIAQMATEAACDCDGAPSGAKETLLAAMVWPELLAEFGAEIDRSAAIADATDMVKAAERLVGCEPEVLYSEIQSRVDEEFRVVESENTGRLELKRRKPIAI
jgi:hypothetical protein